MKSTFLLVLTFGLLVCFSSCDKQINTITPLKKELFSGYVQKGPYLNGSSVQIFELDASLNQTGRSYSTTVAGNSGSFEQKQIELVSNFVQLKADGYYFNEVTGESSTGQLTLYALADISQVNSANVNVLTHLEKSRVEYLVQQKGISFSAAKKQAQTEVLKIFNLSLPTDSTSESLNLSAGGNNNAILLAISCILQGPLSTADMSELMANIISDIKTDGTLDNATLGSQLIDNARLISLPVVRQNLVAKYAELGISNVAIPDFEKQVQTFLTKSTFTPVKIITYPPTGDNGVNILNDTVTCYKTDKGYSLKANLPLGTALKVVIKGNKNSWYYSLIPSPQNWTIATYNDANTSQDFTVTESNKSNDAYLSFNTASDTLTVQYFENNAITPTKTKKIWRVGIKPPVINSGITYPEMGMFVNYYNILSDSLKITRSGKIYSMCALLPYGAKPLKVILKGATQSWIPSPNSFTPLGWTTGTYNSSTVSQEFNTSAPKSDMSFTFPSDNKVTIEIYENNAIVPTKVRYLNN
jgi:hypothetical protein